MNQLPHLYSVSVAASPEGSLRAFADHLPEIKVNAPVQFDGPGDQWSPEELLMAAAANCFVLSFRTVAGIAKLDWVSIECSSSGELDKVERSMVFTKMTNKVRLVVADPVSKSKAETLLRKAEAICIVSNSLSADKFLELEVLSK
ncbi:OsmC family protein [Zhongshania borealis]|uniref:OsmC family peroxiredoxin n=1 Tax=Zhongshania borealis TaxID=889488 RepID=A0ABP7WUS3_9GAMM